MSFWDFALKMAPTVIEAGATILGAKESSKASNQASERLIDAQNRATDAELKALEAARATQLQQQQAASPGLIAQQQIVGQGDALTPLQMRQLDDARRKTADSLQGGSLRGSARATSATIADVEGRMTDQFMDSNRKRADSAASMLAGQYFGAGNQISNLQQKTGASVSNGIVNTGEVDAANTMGQAAIKGNAIGDIGALIADQFKSDQQKKRDSSYQPVGQDIVWDGPRRGGI